MAEYSLALGLAMQRNIFELGRTGDKTFQTTPSFKDSIIGVIGAGKIGSKIISEAKAFAPKTVVYYSRTQKDNGATFVPLDELLSNSDIIFIAIPGTVDQLLNSTAINKIKKNSLVISISPINVIDMDALFTRLKQGTLRAAVDWPAPTDEFKNLPLHTWFNSNDHIAYNTYQALKQCSDMATESIVNLLKTGKDKYKVN